MPRIDHRIEIADVLTPRERLLLDFCVTQLNILRQQLSLPILTQQAVRQAVRDWLRAHPHEGGT